MRLDQAQGPARARVSDSRSPLCGFYIIYHQYYNTPRGTLKSARG
jgi:hypothetical protein